MPRDQVEAPVEKASISRSALTAPTALMAELFKALRPLASFDRAGNPIDRTDDDQRAFRILKPLIGNYTVADAAMLLAALYAHGSTADEFECDAAFRLRSVLEAFVGQARISTATCAETRAYIAAMPTDEDKEHASEFTITCIRERICWDLRDVRDGKFHGEQFAGSPFNKMPNWLDDHEKRFEIWKAGP